MSIFPPHHKTGFSLNQLRMSFVLQPGLMQLNKVVILRGFIMGQTGKYPVERFTQLDSLMKNRFGLSRHLPPLRHDLL